MDEMRCLPLDARGGTIFFQPVSARFERGSIILTSTRALSLLGYFYTTVLAVKGPLHRAKAARP
jgi:hypothetical protein